jgi:hypothetical protein
VAGIGTASLSEVALCPVFIEIKLYLRRPVRKADNLPPSSADVTESGSLNLPDPSGSHRPVMGMLKKAYVTDIELDYSYCHERFPDEMRKCKVATLNVPQC